MIQVKNALQTALEAAVGQVAPGHGLAVTFESPRQAAHGDLAVTAAMALARPLQKNPRELAQALVDALRAQPAVQEWVQALDIAGPGFINLRLTPAARQTVVAEVLTQGACFGRRAATGQQVMVEFVSANPTGPLHVGHGRQAALGDALCNLLESQGAQVQREFYYNDAGVQIATLATSVQARAKGFKPGDAQWPEAAYNGDYIADIARDFLARASVQADDRAFTASGDVNDLDSIGQFAVAYLRHEQDLDLQAFGVRFDHYYLESGLYTSGRVEQTVQRLVAAGKTYEEGGALWLRSTDYGDDKDRVMRKSATVDAEGQEMQGGYTYFVPDVAYHIHKWERGFTQVINVQGKRAGSYVTLRDLIEWTSRDAVRFFLISRKADTEFTFDVDLALQQNDENPVFYVQYAHARICSVLEQFAHGGGDLSTLSDANLALLSAPTESALMLKLAQYPDMLTSAARDLAPHDVAFFARDLAGAFHSYYAAERFLVSDPQLARARLALLQATRQVLANALAVVGVSAPQRLERPVHEEVAA